MPMVPSLHMEECKRCIAICCTAAVVPLDPHYKWDRDLLEAGTWQWHDTDRGREKIMKRRRSGACVHLDGETHQCTIYAKRPLACRQWGCLLTRHDAAAVAEAAVAHDIDPRGYPTMEFLRRKAPVIYKRMLKLAGLHFDE